MPSISTHIAFARLILPQLEKARNPYYFLLGTIAPDTFDRTDSGSFQRHHFAGNAGSLDLGQLREVVDQVHLGCGLNETSFADGYYAHLWLDDYARAHEDGIAVRNPAGLNEGDLRKAVRASMEQYNITIIGDFLERIEIPSPSLESVPGLEFVSIAHTKNIFQQFRKASQNDSGDLRVEKVMDEKEYHRFLSAAAAEFSTSNAKP